ncbi:hypothetical protein GALMADRAFT_143968 [Galerina marginata CBS 339.88]|uniref:Uncharacterized protein n=1 Tax=Galerina marginata (strain CBS 339.88) TaxID=685588 RepID=A0A067SMK4_GALM3|nr:hypothetical protein GALMADRAFT_143968 [Galerina marginata CBS 339.88]
MFAILYPNSIRSSGASCARLAWLSNIQRGTCLPFDVGGLGRTGWDDTWDDEDGRQQVEGGELTTTMKGKRQGPEVFDLEDWSSGHPRKRNRHHRPTSRQPTASTLIIGIDHSFVAGSAARCVLPAAQAQASSPCTNSTRILVIALSQPINILPLPEPNALSSLNSAGYTKRLLPESDSRSDS